MDKREEKVSNVDIRSIKIPKKFRRTSPSHVKMDRKRNDIDQGNLKPLTVSSNGTLTDGYATYLILKERGFKSVPVVYCGESNEETYICAHHPNGKKSYWWRVTDRTKQKENLRDGQIAIVKTKSGARRVLIDFVRSFDTPPTERPIKEVIVCLTD